MSEKKPSPPGFLHSIICQVATRSATCMEDVDYNADRMVQWMERAVTGYPGIDLVVFPECCFQGMHSTEYLKLGLTWDSEPIRKVCEACKRLGAYGQ